MDTCLLIFGSQVTSGSEAKHQYQELNLDTIVISLKRTFLSLCMFIYVPYIIC